MLHIPSLSPSEGVYVTVYNYIHVRKQLCIKLTIHHNEKRAEIAIL